MKFTFEKERILLEKEFSSLDKFVFSFVKALDLHEVKYVIVSGYVSIVFGRSRETEDVDLFMEKISFEKFKNLWNDLMPEFECVNAFSAEEAYQEFLLNGLALRFSFKDKFIPNIEIKFAKTELNQFSLNNRIELTINKHKTYISNLELQIAYKLYLGSEKDVEDAIYLWTIFKENLNKEQLKEFAALLKVSNKLTELE